MTLNRFMGGLFCSALLIFTTACGNSFQPNDFRSNGPASPEPAYYGKPTAVSDPITITATAKFLYRQLVFNPNDLTSGGLGTVVNNSSALAIPFAEFHIYNSAGTRVQQGETLTNGNAVFEIPKVADTYTLKVFSRALNDYIKVSVLEDIYANTPYSISLTFTISDSDILAGSKNIGTLYAQANESVSSKIEGGAFNIMFNILLANEYVRRNIEKNGVANDGVPSTNPNNWWVADKVTVYWKAGFNPYTYFRSTNPLSFYSPGERKLYILGGVNGAVRTADTDHFDDSVILHEYGHFLEDVYGNSQSPGGSHNGDFVIDARLAWSEGWANYFQGAVLTGADAYQDNPANPVENRIPTNKRFQYYLDTVGYENNVGFAVAFNLAARGDSQYEYDSSYGDVLGTGTFREVSISRTLYKSSRSPSQEYATGKTGGGVTFKNIWKTFSGEEKGLSGTSANSLANVSLYPIPSMGLFNWLLNRNANNVTNNDWDNILTEENQVKHTHDYAYFLTSGNSCAYSFVNAATEKTLPRDTVPRSHQQMNNDFYLYLHDGNSGNLRIDYTNDSGAAMDLDLILYYGAYVYFEDYYWNANQSSPYIAAQSRRFPDSSSEQVSLNGLPAGFYMLNVKVNTYGKTSAVVGTTTYRIYKNGVQQCGTERP